MTDVVAKTPTRIAGGLGYAQAVLLIIIVSAGLRLAIVSQIGLEYDGNYSVVQARTLAYGYFDHPPMHYWLIWITAKLTGGESPFMMHFPFVLLSGGCTWLIYRITALVFDRRAGFWAAVAFSLAGVFTLAWSFFVLPDGPLFFFLLLTVRLLIPVLFGKPDAQAATLGWLGAGAAAGAALLSKYSAVFLFAGLFLFLATTPSQRKWLGRAAPWLGAVLAGLMFLPVVWWNFRHHWASFSFQGQRAFLSHATPLVRLIDLFENIGRQAFFLVPWLYVPMLYVLGKALVRGPRDERRWFFACLAVCPVLVFTLVNVLQRGLPYWTLSGWLFVFPLFGKEVIELNQAWYGHVRRTAIATAAALIVIAFALTIEAHTGAYATWMARRSPSLQDPFRDPMIEFYTWGDLPEILRERGLLDRRVEFIAGIDWRDTARLDYTLGHDYPVLCVGPDGRNYSLRDTSAFLGRNGLLIDVPREFDVRNGELDTLFSRRERLENIVLTRSGLSAVELRVERVSGLRVPQ